MTVVQKWIRRSHQGPGVVIAAIIVALSIIVGLGAGRGTPIGLMGAVLVLTSVGAAAFSAYFGLRLLVLVLGCIGFAMVPWVGVRVGPELLVGDLVLVAGLVLLIFYRLLNPHLRVWPYAPSLMAVGLIAVGGLVGTFLAPASDQSVSLLELLRFSLSALSTILFFVLLSPDRREVRALSLAFVLGALVTAIIGIANPSSVLYRGRAVGLSDHPNHLGLVVAMAIFVLLGVSWWRSRLVVMGVAVLAAAVFVSGSRAALIGSVGAGLVFLWATRNGVLLRRVLVVLAAALVTLSIGLIDLPAENAVGRLLGQQSAAGSNAQRVVALDTALRKVREHPVTGSGFENALSAHDIYLEYWQAGGLLALAGLAILLAVVIRALLEGRRRRDTLLIGLCCGYVAYLVQGTAGNALRDRYIWVVFALMIAARCTRPSRATALPEPESTADSGKRSGGRRRSGARALWVGPLDLSP